ncbi:MAG TPA: DUF1190 domain-containing protein [Dyella sp.]|uniref:DUF1190 domain-containing protein n=1 Tax=Dyella sp. TaxID=1869338 RepID=UPI002F95315F
MKRSRTAALLLMGATPLLLTACGDDETTREGVYTSVETCTAQLHDASACQQAYDKARNEAATGSPQFASRETCEADYGASRCEERADNGGHSFFVPLMTGFFISQMLRNGSPVSGFASGPAFRNAGGQWQRPDDKSSVYRGSGGTGFAGSRSMRPVSVVADAPMTTVSRGGFGSRAGGRGGSGE